MATLEQLAQALREADAAGNAEDARRLAQAYKSQRDYEIGGGQGQPQVSAAPLKHDDGRLTEAGWAAEAENLRDKREREIQGTSAYDTFTAGMGRSLNQTWDGLRQVGSAAVDQIPGVDLTDYRRRVQSEIDESRREDAPLLDSGWGQAGNVVGAGLQLLTPGALAKSGLAARALLPTTISGNALQGALLGTLQPTATGESRAQNALIGGAAGGAAAGAFKAGGAAFSGVRSLMSPTSRTDGAAARALIGEAADPAALQTVAPSAVPGVRRSLAEESLDPGIARLERTMRSTASTEFDAIDRANNAARVGALRSFGGDDAMLAAAKQERSDVTTPLLDQAMTEGGVDVAPVRDLLEKKLAASASRPSVQSAIQDVQKSLDGAGDDVFSLYGTRKYIDDLLSGKAGGDKSYAKAASAELMQIKNKLDHQIGQASPAFMSYLDKYRELSVPIDRTKLGQSLMDKGGAVKDATTGLTTLTPAQFSQASKNLDAVAAKATGFKKAKATEILRGSDVASIKAIGDDLERQYFRSTAGSGPGSPTASYLATEGRVAAKAGKALAGRIPLVGSYAEDFITMLDRTRNDQLKERIAYLVANPEEARRVIAGLPEARREPVQRLLTELGGTTGAVAGVSAASQDQPLEIDVVGGTPVPLEQFQRMVPD